jgi:hypothetical protein
MVNLESFKVDHSFGRDSKVLRQELTENQIQDFVADGWFLHEEVFKSGTRVIRLNKGINRCNHIIIVSVISAKPVEGLNIPNKVRFNEIEDDRW